MRSDQVKCLCKDSFGRNDGPIPGFERRDAIVVRILVAVNERDKRSSVQQELNGHGASAELDIRGVVDLNPDGR